MKGAACPNCKTALDPAADICDHCGLVLASAPPVSAAVQTLVPCAACGTSNDAGCDYCDHCGRRLQAPSAPGPAGITTCPQCRHPLHGEAICDNCGLLVDSAPLPVPTVAPPPVSASPASEARCPSCGNLHAAGKFCGRCGHRLAADGAPASTAAARTPPSIEVDTVLAAKYRVQRELGQGGMGKVFLAEDEVLKRPVVIKTLVTGDNVELASQAIKEREYLATVKHPNIVAIYDFFTIHSDGYIVMEYVPGQTLFDISEARGAPLKLDEAIGYVLQVLPALGYLHRLGLIYCDFKPQNVILEELKDGARLPKLIDLGTVIRYSDKPDAVYGTNGFFAPEAVTRPTPQTDMYTVARSLAWLVSWMDLDKIPFGMPPAEDYQVFREHPALYKLLARGTHKVPARRFQTAESMMEQLKGVLRLVVGPRSGVTLQSRLFVAGAFSGTGRLGPRVETTLDSGDKALDLLQQGDQALRGGNETAALMFYSQAVGVNPNSVDSHLRLAELHLVQGRHTEALAEINRVQRLDPANWKIAWYTGRLLEAQQNLKAAQAQYEELLDDLPGELPPRQALARVLLAQGHHAEAMVQYQAVVGADPDNTEALLHLASCRMALNQWHEAIDVLDLVGEGASRFVDAQLTVVEVALQRLQPPDLVRAGLALSRLEARTQDPRFYRLRGDYYREAMQLGPARLPQTFVAPGVRAGQSLTRAALGAMAEASYSQYLHKSGDSPDREVVVREKFRCAPWRWW